MIPNHMWLSSAFRRFSAVRLLTILGSILVLIGAAMFALAGGSVVASKEYSFEQKDTAIIFNVEKSTTGPFYVYAFFDSFYANTRRYRDSLPHYMKSSSPSSPLCMDYLTKKDLQKVRPLSTFPIPSNSTSTSPLSSGVSTSPPTPPPRSSPSSDGDNENLKPCGLQAFTFFNDELGPIEKLPCSDPQDCSPEAMVITGIRTQSTALPQMFASFAHTGDKEPSMQNATAWIEPLLNESFQSWFLTPFTPRRILLIGSLNLYLLHRGSYALHITKNCK